jgi:hypothetical protein
MGARKTRRWRSPVPESEECRADELFPSVTYLTPPDRFFMSVCQEPILVAEGT